MLQYFAAHPELFLVGLVLVASFVALAALVRGGRRAAREEAAMALRERVELALLEDLLDAADHDDAPRIFALGTALRAF